MAAFGKARRRLPQAAADEDADWLGLSLLSGAHMTLVPRVLDAIRATGNRRVQCLVGGIVPDKDAECLTNMGVRGIFGPGTSISKIVDFLRRHTPQQPDASDVRHIGDGDRVALGRLLSLIEQGRAPKKLLGQWRRHRSDSKMRAVAFTGSAGVGKSSLIAKLLATLRQRNQRVAVLACDPKSPVNGGALLGDRVRMSEGSGHDTRILVRSLAVPSGQQGITTHLGDMLLALDRFGFDLVLVESVGIGQGDVAIRQYVDSVTVLLQPESGDAIQWEKAGLLEIADLIAIHKCDLPGADRLENELREHLNLPGCRNVPIVRTGNREQQGWSEFYKFVVGTG